MNDEKVEIPAKKQIINEIFGETKDKKLEIHAKQEVTNEENPEIIYSGGEESKFGGVTDSEPTNDDKFEIPAKEDKIIEENSKGRETRRLFESIMEELDCLNEEIISFKPLGSYEESQDIEGTNQSHYLCTNQDENKDDQLKCIEKFLMEGGFYTECSELGFKQEEEYYLQEWQKIVEWLAAEPYSIPPWRENLTEKCADNTKFRREDNCEIMQLQSRDEQSNLHDNSLLTDTSDGVIVTCVEQDKNEVMTNNIERGKDIERSVLMHARQNRFIRMAESSLTFEYRSITLFINFCGDSIKIMMATDDDERSKILLVNTKISH
ncbi:hypothetical protein LguiA_032044 [Lonicera macranthoides]